MTGSEIPHKSFTPALAGRGGIPSQIVGLVQRRGDGPEHAGHLLAGAFEAMPARALEAEGIAFLEDIGLVLDPELHRPGDDHACFLALVAVVLGTRRAA